MTGCVILEGLVVGKFYNNPDSDIDGADVFGGDDAI